MAKPIMAIIWATSGLCAPEERWWGHVLPRGQTITALASSKSSTLVFRLP